MTLSVDQENDVLRIVQHGVPFVRRPFSDVGERSGVSERGVLDLLRRWSDEGKLREISAILEGSALGYESALVAGSVPERNLDRVVGIVNAHPTVTHNYLRDHEYNLWFTIAVPRSMGLDASVEALSRLAGVRFHALRRTETFKIGVNFDLRTLENRTEATPLASVGPVEVSPLAVGYFRALQTPAPIVEEPFHALAREHEIDADRLLAFANEHLGGAIRRYVGTLRHRKIGIRSNAMIVWNVSLDRISQIGPRLARAPEVSHCYGRTPIEGFPYTLYSMIHGPSFDACQAIAARISREIEVEDYRLLVSSEEYKKERLRYFLPELDEWWSAHGAR